jgi:hypothetical protein
LQTIDRFSYQWSSLGAAKRFLTVPNHLLRDIITAWCLDHEIPLPSSTSTSVASEEAPPPTEEEMQLLLEKLSMHSAAQKEALHRIQLLSTSSKGVHPCLDRWQDLLPKLMCLHKEWRSTWARQWEEERLTVMLNLSLHRVNRDILARQERLPHALKETSARAGRHGYPLTVMLKVSSLVTILSESEYSTFRRKFVEIDGIEELHVLLCNRDCLVRNEASAAILALCRDDAAALTRVPDASLVECLSDGMVTDECLLLLECTSDRESVRDRIAFSVELLMEAIMATENGQGYLSSRGTRTALALIYNCIKEADGRGRLRTTVILQGFVEALRILERKETPLRTVFQIEEIHSIVSQALAELTQWNIRS